MEQQLSDLDRDKKNLDQRWFRKDPNKDEKAKTKEILLNSSFIFDRLKEDILKDMFSQAQIKPSDLDKPNFESRYIFMDGYRRALQEVFRSLP